ncbi:MAG: hypothetical protein NW237_15085 [Cyanobacteriota bacterium]|nr:hypothetical protein [Cyanobacteriota bacterium]
MNYQSLGVDRWFAQAVLVTATAVSLASWPTVVRAQQITDPSPAQAATNVVPESPISASFRAVDGVAVRPETVKILVDNRDVTAQSVITKDFFSYRPTTPLSLGRHEVLLEFTNTQGVTRRVAWGFEVGNPIKATIDSVVHNAANRALAAGEIMLVTVKGTPASKVNVYLVQDGQKVQNLTAQEVDPGIYVVNALIESKDTTKEGILIARLENSGQVKFATAEQAVRLVQGATAGVQRLTTQEVNASLAQQLTGNQLQPQITNYRDGDRISGSSFVLQGKTLPNASVQVKVNAENNLGGIISAQRTLVNQSVQANSQGIFSITITPSVPAAGTVYRVEMKSTANGQTSPTVSLQLVQQ